MNIIIIIRYEPSSKKKRNIEFIGYIICIILSFFVNRLFTGISFDAGGAVSGPLTVSFLLPMAIGITYSLGGNIMTDAFGLVALVTLLPIVVIQIFGLVYRFKSKILGTYDSYDDIKRGILSTKGNAKVIIDITIAFYNFLNFSQHVLLLI